MASHQIQGPWPLRCRAYRIWRRPKGNGTGYLWNGVCALPKTDDHIRGPKLTESEITEARGTCVILETMAQEAAQEEKAVNRFKADRDDAYMEVIVKCDNFVAEVAQVITAGHDNYADPEASYVDPQKLQGWFEKRATREFFAAPRPGEARARLIGCEAAQDDYARPVFEGRGEHGGSGRPALTQIETHEAACRPVFPSGPVPRLSRVRPWSDRQRQRPPLEGLGDHKSDEIRVTRDKAQVREARS